jgi:hypothetical protein
MADSVLNVQKSLVWFLLLTIASLFGCSDSSKSGSASTGNTSAVAAAKIQLTSSLPQILTSSTSTTVLTAIVLDANGQAISGKAVNFSVGGDSSAYFTGTSATTDANGVATATLNLGDNMANRTIAASASVDGVTGTANIAVDGTTIAISGNTSLSLNASADLIISVKNSKGVAVPGVTVSATSQNGNTVTNKSPSTWVTDSNGQVTLTVTATVATSSDTITVSGAGASQLQSLAVSTTTTNFAFTTPVTIVPPATTPELLVGTSIPVKILWTAGGFPQVGKAVSFYSTRGGVTGSPATTDATGTATVNLVATSTGLTTITAKGPGGIPSASLDVVFVTDTASSITAQSNPGTIGINTGTSKANQATISVVVRDASLNLVKNANVAFNLVADPSSGALSAPTATTDISGTAAVNYIAGGASSGVNQISIDATVDSVNGVTITPITANTTLTVAGQTYFVRLETDNTVGGTGSEYTKTYRALVTDSAGHAVPNTTVYFSLRPLAPPAKSFAKGIYSVVSGAWKQQVAVSCASEDLNQNGVRDFLPVDEDLNMNGRLDPYGVATVNDKANTDATGYASATITYSKNFAYWVRLDLEARTSVSGNDPPSIVTVPLVGAAADYADIKIAPPGEVSPFGPGNACTDTN